MSESKYIAVETNMPELLHELVFSLKEIHNLESQDHPIDLENPLSGTVNSCAESCIKTVLEAIESIALKIIETNGHNNH